MNVFDGQSTVSPRTPAYSSAASAEPLQLEVATAGRPFQPDQAVSNASVIGPSDQRSLSSACSQSSCSRARSRWSKPIAKRAKAVSVSIASFTSATVPDSPAVPLPVSQVIVTFLTSGSLNTLPIWILGNLRNVQRLPEVNVVAMLVILITVVPVYLAQRLMQASGGVGPR